MSQGDLAGLEQLLDREPTLAKARSLRYHRATLLHYLGNNGIERTVAPENAAAIARLLIERGAEVDASCRMYGGGPYEKTLGLATTSDPAQYPPGVLAELIAALVAGGGRVHEIDGRSRALEGAMQYGATIAVGVLRQLGARAYDLATAAALGDLAVLESQLEAADDAQRIAALESAAAFGRLSVLERLLAAGVDLDSRGAYGGTALHKAAASNAADSVRWLLEHGADREARDRAHQGTPADWARHFGSRAALDALER
jgi:ankyrin repeat protein